MITDNNDKVKLFEKYNITGINASNNGNQYLKCPQTECRNREKSYYETLSVNIEKGTWNCHHCGWKGSIYTDLKTNAIPNFDNSLGRYYDIESNDDFVEFFKKRGISKLTLWELGVKWKNKKWRHKDEFGDEIEELLPTIMFVNLIGENVVNVKYRRLDAKRFMQLTGGVKVFYNLNSLKNADTAIIVEGEIDVMSLHEIGYTNVISVPEGAPNEKSENYATKFEFIKNSMPYLS